ncbi:hypothetical protein [Pseudomonas sp. S1Bt23]|uniref:hypothetical protein n=1 Tax=Pseudomonas sp. S1Bt23 TaxID=3095074 RepID=UPI002A5A1CB4|nr:hypothetical protein [Pseudomonas sp. S1Bt23]WPO48361.1 hypothetical protein SHB59_04585 [Pseudomonas sp. S1Bt23]
MVMTSETGFISSQKKPPKEAHFPIFMPAPFPVAAAAGCDRRRSRGNPAEAFSRQIADAGFAATALPIAASQARQRLHRHRDSPVDQ